MCSPSCPPRPTRCRASTPSRVVSIAASCCLSTVLLTAPQGNVLDDLEQDRPGLQALAAAPEVQRVRSVLQPTGDERRRPCSMSIRRSSRQPMGSTRWSKGSTTRRLMRQSSGRSSGQHGRPERVPDRPGQLPGCCCQCLLPRSCHPTKSVDAGLTKLTDAGKLTNQLDGLSKQMAQLAQTIKAATTAPTAPAPRAAAGRP